MEFVAPREGVRMGRVPAAWISAWLICAGQLSGQQGTPPGSGDRFEAVSVKPSPPTNGERVRATPPTVAGNRVVMRNAPVRSLVLFAYEPIQGREIVGGPRWMDGDQLYDVEAVADAPLTAERAKLLVRQLLADRFRLRAHYETRERKVSILRLLKAGAGVPKALVRSTFDCDAYTQRQREWLASQPAIPTPAEIKAIAASAPAPSRAANGALVCTVSPAPNMVSGGVTMATLAERLSTDGVIVLDRTGLEGAYEFTLKYLPDRMKPQGGGPSLLPDAQPLDLALPEQLGLRLETQRMPLEVLVVDAIERPTEN